MLKLLNGKELADSLRQELTEKVKSLNFTPRLGVVLVGEDPASHLYVNLKEKAAQEVGIRVEKKTFPENAKIEEVLAQIKTFNDNSNIHAILVQLPLPAQFNTQVVINAIDPQKDADGFHPENIKNFLTNSKSITPAVSQGIIKLIELAKINLRGKTATLLVNSKEFAEPLTKILNDRGVLVKVTNNIDPSILKNSDIIVVALGKPNEIKNNSIKDGAVVVDVGTTKVGDRVIGDVDTASVRDLNIFLTPVPGGVGPMTVVMLLWNVYTLAKNRQ